MLVQMEIILIITMEKINDEGKGEIITFTIYDGEVYFNATILELDETSIDFEYTIDDVKLRFVMKK